MLGHVEDHAPHGGPIVLPVVANRLAYVVAIVAGTLVTAISVNLVKALTKQKSSATAMNIVAVTACPTGIAHTYMAAEQLEKTGQGARPPHQGRDPGSDGHRERNQPRGNRGGGRGDLRRRYPGGAARAFRREEDFRGAGEAGHQGSEGRASQCWRDAPWRWNTAWPACCPTACTPGRPPTCKPWRAASRRRSTLVNERTGRGGECQERAGPDQRGHPDGRPDAAARERPGAGSRPSRT